MCKVILTIFILFSLVNCSYAPFKQDWFQSSGTFKLRPIKEVNLENGLKVIFIHDDSLPRVSLQTLIKVGARQEEAELGGLNSMTADLLEQGTQGRHALKIADILGALGTEIGITGGADFTTISADALVSSAEDLLDVYADVLLNPAFKDKDIERMRAQYLAQIQKKVDNPSSFSDDQYDSFLFGTHPYGRPLEGSANSIKKISKSDIIKHYLAYYRPNNATLAVVGSFSADYEQKVSEVFGRWSKKNVKGVALAPISQISEFKMRLVTKSGLKQTQIHMGRIGIERKSDDYLTLRLANEILGGSFASRLMQHIRDDLGLTYGVHSYIDAKLDPGSFSISTFTKNESVGKTIDETLKVYKEFAEKGANEKELQAAKAQLIGQFPRAVETPDRFAFNLLVLDFYGIPKTYLTDFNKNIERISLSQLNAVIRRHLEPNKLKVLVYGDQKFIADQLKSYSPEVVKVEK